MAFATAHHHSAGGYVQVTASMDRASGKSLLNVCCFRADMMHETSVPAKINDMFLRVDGCSPVHSNGYYVRACAGTAGQPPSATTSLVKARSHVPTIIGMSIGDTPTLASPRIDRVRQRS